ncbi:MAG: DUF4153 domain-containing protein [Lachnospiraceae bacterium]|nr:DUF4153 domain-containing protein [Lachnospiraceae bacterium]
MKTKELILGFVKKYKIESVAVLIFSVLSAVAFDTYVTKPMPLFEVIAVFAFVAAGTFLVDKIFIVYENEIRQNVGNKETSFKVARQIAYSVVLVLEYLLCMWAVYLMNHAQILREATVFSPYEQIHALIVAAAIVLEVVLPIVIYLVIKEKRLSLKEYMLKLFMNSIFVFVICCVVLAGILVLYLICEALLGTIPYYIISRIIVFLLSMISFMGLFVSIENVDGRQSLFSKILVRYIMQIMVFIGFVIFYIYLVKIIVKLELPSNQVFVVCTTLFSIGLMTSLMSLGVNEESKYNIATKFLPVAFIPALILQIISLGLRIGQHGLTQNRYVGVMIIIFEIVYLVFYIRNEILNKERVKLEKVLLVASLLILISCFVPKINMYELPGICNKVFNVKNIDVNE